MTARPLISVFNAQNPSEVTSSISLPTVFTAPIRDDIVHFVHYNLAKNSRQPYAVSTKAGHQHSAESWGPGRAVARIPRVSGSGTHRAGQGAFGNMCRKGRMFAPTKIWRRWHRKVNLQQKRHATAAALAASALPSLVMARGHRIERINEVPLVIDNFLHVEKTRDVLALLRNLGVDDEIKKVHDSCKIRKGRGKMRNRRYVQRRGPLLVYNEQSDKLLHACRNIPGLDVSSVHRLNLRQLAPGGSLGRFIIWTKGAFAELDNIFGTYRKKGVEKKGYQLQRPMMVNPDVARIINSDAIQSVVKPAGPSKTDRGIHNKKNPLKNRVAMNSLNPYERMRRHITKLQLKKRSAELEKLRNAKRGVTAALSAKEKKELKDRKKNSKAWFKDVRTNMVEAYPKPEAIFDDEEDEDEEAED